MQVGAVGSYMPVVANANVSEQQSVSVAKKALDQTKEEGEQALRLISSAAPPGTGKIINLTG